MDKHTTIIDGKTGRVVDEYRPTGEDRPERGQRDRQDRPDRRDDRGSAHFIYDDLGHPAPYRPGQEC